MQTSYIQGANGVILMYDITNQDSLHIIPRWIDMVNDYSAENKIQIPIFLVGNKSDLAEDREVSEEYAQK